MHTTTFQKTDKSARLRGLIGLLLIFSLWNPVRSQTYDADGWNSNKLLMATANAEVLLRTNPENGLFQNMAYGFKYGHNTLHKLGWYVGVMTNFQLFGAFKAVDEDNLYPNECSTSFLEADFGLTFHKFKRCSYHLGTGYFLRTKNHLDHDYNIAHLRGTAEHGIVITTGPTWHIEMSDKYIREKRPEKVSLSLEAVGLISFNHTSKSDMFSYGLKLGVGFSSPRTMQPNKPVLPNNNPPQVQDDTPPVIAENKTKEKDANAKQKQKHDNPNVEQSNDQTIPSDDTQDKGIEVESTKNAPSVEIGVARNISEYSIEITGLLRDNGSSEVSERGFCYSRYGTPALNAESKIITVNSRSSMFSSTINNLQSGTTYSIRAYAINDVDTSYSEIINVKTKDILSINSIYELKPTSATIVFTNTNDVVNSDDVVRRGICYSDSTSNSTPTVSDNVITKESNAIFQIIENLECGKRYYVRAFTEKSNGTVDYSDIISFFTPNYLTTRPISNIGTTSATAGGEIQYNLPEPIVQAGSCWSLKNPNPTTVNTRTVGDEVSNGQWTSSMENQLKPETKYWIRAYVITASGQTYYGNVITFTTLKEE